MYLSHTLKNIFHHTRSGVIPYIINKEGIIYFLLGVDRRSGEITDFGGGVKKNESSLVAGVREFKEESREIFCNYDLNNFETSLALTNDKMCIIFKGIDYNYFTPAPANNRETEVSRESESFVRHLFKKNEHLNDELSDVLWVHQEDFFKMIDKSPFNSSVYATYANTNNNVYVSAINIDNVSADFEVKMGGEKLWDKIRNFFYYFFVKSSQDDFLLLLKELYL